MLKILTTCVLSGLLLGCGGGSFDLPFIKSAEAQTPTVEGIRWGGMILDTEPFPCDHQERTWRWTNPLSVPVKVVLSRQWIGLDYGVESDTQAISYVFAPGDVIISMLAIQQLDNYRHRSFEQERVMSFAPSYVEIPVGGGVLLKSFCNKISGGNNAHVTLSIWHI